MVLDDSVLARNDALREMMRMVRAIVADGTLTSGEARRLQGWIDSNPHVRGIPAVDEIAGLLTNAFADGEPSDAERTALVEHLDGFGG